MFQRRPPQIHQTVNNYLRTVCFFFFLCWGTSISVLESGSCGQTERKMNIRLQLGRNNQSVSELVCSTGLVQSTPKWGMMENILSGKLSLNIIRAVKQQVGSSTFETVARPQPKGETQHIWASARSSLAWSTKEEVGGGGCINHRYSFETLRCFTVLVAGT